MRKLVFLILVVLFAAYAGWAEQRPVRHYLSDLRSEVALDVGQPSGNGNLLGIQPQLYAADYQSPRRLHLKLHAYLNNAQSLGLLNDRTVIVFPEHIGTWLAMANEKPEVYRAGTLEEALKWMAISNPLKLTRHWFGARAEDRMSDAVLRMKAVDMAHQYQALFGELAKTFQVTIVAGSILLPGPHLRNDRLIPGHGPLQNIGMVFLADGKPNGTFYRKGTAENWERTLMRSRLFNPYQAQTPAGRMTVWLGHEDRRENENAIDFEVNPSFYPAPEQASSYADRRTVALGVAMQGRLWDLPLGDGNWIITPQRRHNAHSGQGAHLLNIWL